MNHKLFIIINIFLLITFIGSPISTISSSSRPQWLLSQTDVSTQIWTIDDDYHATDGWYFGLNAPNGGFISVQPQEFSSPNQALEKVLGDNATIQQVIKTGELEYAFENYRVNMNAVTTGFVWEVKSPCCYSRGITFSLKNSYVYIFGSQQTKWPDLIYIFNKQVVKLQNYYNISVSNSMLQEINQYQQTYENSNIFSLNSASFAGIFFIIVLPSLAIIMAISGHVKKKKLKNKK